MKKIRMLILGLFAIAMLSAFALAQNENGAKEKDNSTPKAYGLNNATYGSCVSDFAIVKNGCFLASKDAKTACKTEALNATDAKTAVKQCNKDYRASKKQCMVDFKASKKECRKLKQKAK